MTRTLVVRLDSDGDVLLAGPAVRALATAGPVDLLASPVGQGAARLLPGVTDVLVFDAPWSGYRPPQTDPAALAALVAELAGRRYDRAVVLTSFHQSPLPMALLARVAGIPYVAADCEDYPGSLLDVRHRRRDVHEAVAGLELAAAAGAELPPGDDGRLAVLPPPAPEVPLPDGPFVVVHPGASVPARAPRPEHAAVMVDALLRAGHDVVVTGGPAEIADCAVVSAPGALDLSGRTSLAQLSAVLRRADSLVSGNTGPAHLAAAVGTPVVSLFAPVVPAERWAPYGVPVVLLGDQHALCRDSRARECPVPGHPCLGGIDPQKVVAAVRSLAVTRVLDTGAA